MVVAALSLRVPLLFVVLVGCAWAIAAAGRRFGRLADGLVELPPLDRSTLRPYAAVFATPIAMGLAFGGASWALFDLVPLFRNDRSPCCCCLIGGVHLLAMFAALCVFSSIVVMWYKASVPTLRRSAPAGVRRTARTEWLRRALARARRRGGRPLGVRRAYAAHVSDRRPRSLPDASIRRARRVRRLANLIRAAGVDRQAEAASLQRGVTALRIASPSVARSAA